MNVISALLLQGFDTQARPETLSGGAFPFDALLPDLSTQQDLAGDPGGDLPKTESAPEVELGSEAETPDPDMGADVVAGSFRIKVLTGSEGDGSEVAAETRPDPSGVDPRKGPKEISTLRAPDSSPGHQETSGSVLTSLIESLKRATAQDPSGPIPLLEEDVAGLDEAPDIPEAVRIASPAPEEEVDASPEPVVTATADAAASSAVRAGVEHASDEGAFSKPKVGAGAIPPRSEPQGAEMSEAGRSGHVSSRSAASFFTPSAVLDITPGTDQEESSAVGQLPETTGREASARTAAAEVLRPDDSGAKAPRSAVREHVGQPAPLVRTANASFSEDLSASPSTETVDRDIFQLPAPQAEAARPHQTLTPPQEVLRSFRSTVARGAAQQISGAISDGDSVTVRLKPQGMGIVEISISEKDGAREISLRVQNPLVLEALRSERSALADLLSGQSRGDNVSLDLFRHGGDRSGSENRENRPASRAGTSSGEADETETRNETYPVRGPNDLTI